MPRAVSGPGRGVSAGAPVASVLGRACVGWLLVKLGLGQETPEVGRPRGRGPEKKGLCNALAHINLGKCAF